MKFSIKNIGGIDNATVDIDGITIIAGENNVGKSTIGKALYAFLHGMSAWEKVYDASCYQIIREFLYQNSVWLEDFCMKESGAKRRRTSKSNQLISQYAADPDFRVAIEDYQIHESLADIEKSNDTLDVYLRDYSFDYFSLYFKESKEELSRLYADDLTEWVSSALNAFSRLNIDELELQKNAIRHSFQQVFNKQHRKIGTTESQIVFTDEQNREIHFSIDDNGESLDSTIRLTTNIYFLESPKIYDYISNAKFAPNPIRYLRRMMVPNTFRAPITVADHYASMDSSDDISGDVKPIIDHLADVMGGQAEFLQKVGLEFKDRKIAEPIHAVNVSTGLKSLALLEYALRVGAIERGDILVMDEPEINLHPEWQLEYAKTIVDLQKHYGIKFVITSHSPFFMRSIECYTDISGTMDHLNVYRVCCPDRADARTVINVSYSEYGMSDLYEDLSAPLYKLDELLNKKYGADDGE